MPPRNTELPPAARSAFFSAATPPMWGPNNSSAYSLSYAISRMPDYLHNCSIRLVRL